MDGHQFNIRMQQRKHTKYLIREGMAYEFHVSEVEQDRLELLDPGQQAFCLRSGNKRILLVPSHSYRDHRLATGPGPGNPSTWAITF